MDRHMDNNVHWSDLIAFKLRSLFNEEGSNGVQYCACCNVASKLTILDQNAHVASWRPWPTRARIASSNCASTTTCASLSLCCTRRQEHLTLYYGIISNFDDYVFENIISNISWFYHTRVYDCSIFVVCVLWYNLCVNIEIQNNSNVVWLVVVIVAHYC